MTRSVVLGLFGLGIALLGGAIFSVQKGFWLALGILYLALGIAIILNARFRWGLFGSFSLSRLLPKRMDSSLGMGVVFGLNLPACAVPLMLALLGRSAASGAAWGFASLFVFGLALSLPLVPLALSERAAKLLRRPTRLAGRPLTSSGLSSSWSPSTSFTPRHPISTQREIDHRNLPAAQPASAGAFATALAGKLAQHPPVEILHRAHGTRRPAGLCRRQRTCPSTRCRRSSPKGGCSDEHWSERVSAGVATRPE